MTPKGHRHQLHLEDQGACGRELHYVMTKVWRLIMTPLRKCTADRQLQVLHRRQDQVHPLRRARNLAHVLRDPQLVGTALLHLHLAQPVCGAPCTLPPRSVAWFVPVPRPLWSQLQYGSDHVQQELLRRCWPRIVGRRRHRRQLLVRVARAAANHLAHSLAQASGFRPWQRQAPLRQQPRCLHHHQVRFRHHRRHRRSVALAVGQSSTCRLG